MLLSNVLAPDQNERLQTDALTAAGGERIFVDHTSGAKEHRPQLDRLLDVVWDGDTLAVWELDRLGRSVRHLVDLMNRPQAIGVGFRSLTENMDTTTPGGVMVFNAFAAMARFERDLIRGRTNAGLDAARRWSRPNRLDMMERREVRDPYRSTRDERHAHRYHVSRQTTRGPYTTIDQE